MATNARLGIDIVAADRTRAAFSSAQRSLAAFTRGLKLIAGIAVGGGFAATLKKGIGSLIEINKHAGPVKTSFELISRAWQDFALNVGSSGLNDALLKFNASIGQMIVGSGSLAGSLGRILGSSVKMLTSFLQGLGRSLAFAYDNSEIFGRAIKGLGLLYVAGRVTMLARGFVILISTLRAAGLATAIFSLIQRRMLVFWVAIIAIGAKVTGTFDNLSKAVDNAISTAEDLLPLLGNSVADGIKKMGFDVKSLTADFSVFDGELKNLPKTFEEIEEATKKGAPALKVYNRGITDLKQFISGLRDEGAALGKTEGALARLAQSQAFYNKMQDQGVKLTKAQKAAAEEWLNKIPDAVAGLERQKAALQTAIDIGDEFKSSFSTAFASVVDGTMSVKKAFSSMVSSLLNKLTNLFANKAFDMLVGGGPGAGGTGGLVGALFSSFKGGFASGGTLGAGKWGIAGENGPEPIVGPATVIPNRGSSVKLTIVNNNGSQITTREKTDAQGNREIIAMVDQRIAQQMADPYSRSSPALAARGARPQLKQR